MSRVLLVELIQQGQDSSTTISINDSHTVFDQLTVDNSGSTLAVILTQIVTSLASGLLLGRLDITGFNVGSDNDVDVLPSRWAIKFGARYEF